MQHKMLSVHKGMPPGVIPQCVVASNLEACCRQQQIGLVVLDVVMPKVSGPKAYEMMSGVRAGVPVIYILGYSESMAGMARQDARVQMLLKPFTVEELGRRVRQTLDETREHGRLRTRR